MRVIFIGTPEFALPSMAKLHDKHQILSVITQPDRPKGRHLELAMPPVKVLARKLLIPILQPETLISNPDLTDKLEKLSADVVIVCAYGKIIPKWLLGLCRFGCINLHGSLLPEYRGAAPIQRAILDGKLETGVTTMKMSEGLDTGDIYLQARAEIKSDENAGSLGKKLSEIGADLIIATLGGLANGTLIEKPQDDSLATIANKLSKVEMRIDWRKDYEDICRLVRALAPSPGAYMTIGNKRLKVLAAQPLRCGDNDPPGTIISASDELVIAAKGGSVTLVKVKLEGKQEMSGAAFARGQHLKAGDVI